LPNPLHIFYSRIRSAFRAVLHRAGFEQGMDDEMRFHLDARQADLIRSGLSPAQALRQARLEFGNPAAIQEDCRQARGLRFLDELSQDLRYAVRTMRQRPGFTLTAVLFLGLTIGANTALFTFVNAYVFRPLPVSNAERHFDITGAREHGRTTGRWSRHEADFFIAQTASIADLYSIERTAAALMLDHPLKSEVNLVSTNFLSLLGARFMLGQPPGASPASPELALSHAGWVRLFQSDPSAVGRQVRVGTAFFTITGVLDPSFTGVEALTPDIWTLLPNRDLLFPRETPSMIQLGGILRSGVDVRQVQAALRAAIPVVNQSGATNELVTAIEATVRPAIARNETGNDVGIGIVEFAFFLLLVVVCANLASLYLAGAHARQRELAIRLSIGAGRARIVRQLLTEALLISFIGAAAACVLALLSIDAIQAILYEVFARLGMNAVPVGPDWRVFLFTVGLAVVAAVAFGLLPALQATRGASLATIGAQRAGMAVGRHRPSRLRYALIATQTACSLILLVLAGVLSQNVTRMANLDPGYPVQGLYDTDFHGDLQAFEKRLAADPRISGITTAMRIPLWGAMYQRAATVDGANLSLAFNYVDHRFFDTIGIRIRRGRGFTAAESANQAPVAVISEATARRLWPNRDAIGQTIVTEPVPEESQPRRALQVIGVANDVVSGLLFVGADRTLVYLPSSGTEPVKQMIVRSSAPGPVIIPALQQACLDLDPTAFCRTIALTEVAWMQRFPFRIASHVALALAALALVLSCAGLYGVVAFTVVQRTREAGIRLALGSSAWRVIHSMLASSLRSVAIGAAVGLPLCYIAARFADSMASFLHLSDPAVFVAVPAILFFAVFLATVFPARRAASVDPAIALRQD
jgi:predicted permease